MGQSLYNYCKENDRTELLDQWDEAGNRPRTPQTVSYGSHYKAQWRCGAGHTWRAQVFSRVGNQSGCPVCAGKTVIAGVNDLASKFPLLAKEWHPAKNGTLTPENVGAYTHRKAWWRCETCGHEWNAEITSRANGSGCPACAGKTVVPGVNDLASKFPLLAEEWHPMKNGRLTPETVTPQSNRKVWWRCSLGHEYQSRISGRTVGKAGCPYCADRQVLQGFNDLATILPQIAAQWHPTLNEGLTPEEVTCGSARRVWWKCGVCGWEWKAVVYSRAGSQRCGCPNCAGNVRTNNRPRYQRTAADTCLRQDRRYVSEASPPLRRGMSVLSRTGTDPP